jgi:protein-S-isoprenylcysteine O-methyltransferase Ste14
MAEAKPDTCGVVVIPPVVFGFCLIGGIAATFAYDGVVHGIPALLRWTAAGLTAAVGGTLAIWGLDLFRRFRTPYLHHQPTARLVTAGAYRVTRNPMYVGLVAALAALGLGFAALPILLSAVVMFAYLNWYVVPREEAYLTRLFGDDYGTYSAKVRRWL